MAFKAGIKDEYGEKPALGYLYTIAIENINIAAKDGNEYQYVELVDQLSKMLRPKEHADFKEAVRRLEEKYNKIAKQMPVDRQGNMLADAETNLYYQKAKEHFGLLMQLIHDVSFEKDIHDEIGLVEDDVVDEALEVEE